MEGNSINTCFFFLFLKLVFTFGGCHCASGAKMPRDFTGGKSMNNSTPYYAVFFGQNRAVFLT